MPKNQMLVNRFHLYRVHCFRNGLHRFCQNLKNLFIFFCHHSYTNNIRIIFEHFMSQQAKYKCFKKKKVIGVSQCTRLSLKTQLRHSLFLFLWPSCLPSCLLLSSPPSFFPPFLFSFLPPFLPSSLPPSLFLSFLSFLPSFFHTNGMCKFPARDQTHAIAETQATAVIMPGPQPTVPQRNSSSFLFKSFENNNND